MQKPENMGACPVCSAHAGTPCLPFSRNPAPPPMKGFHKGRKVSTPLPQQEGYEKCTRCRHEKNLHNGGVSNYCLINGCNCQQFCARGPSALPQQEEPAKESNGFICAEWRIRQEGPILDFGTMKRRQLVNRCDLPEGHEGDHVDQVILVNWSKSEPIAPLLGQDEPIPATELPIVPIKVRWESWADYWRRAFDERTKSLTQALTSLAAAEHDANLWKELHGAVNASLAAMTEDRNFWKDGHNEDCPNLASLAESQKRITELEKELGR